MEHKLLNHKVNVLEHEIIAHKSACKIYFENEKESFELYIADLGETTEFDFELGKTVVTGHEYSLVLTFLDRVVLYNEESEYIEEYFMFNSIEDLAAEAVDIIKSYNAIFGPETTMRSGSRLRERARVITWNAKGNFTL